MASRNMPEEDKSLGYEVLRKMGQCLAKEKTRVREIFRRLDKDGGGVFPP